MNTASLIALLGGISTVLGATLAALLTGRATTRASAQDNEAGAYLRAREIDEGILKELRADHARLASEVRQLRDELDEQRTRGDRLERELHDERRKTTQLERQLQASGYSAPGP